jgi:hypothetical protein
MPKIVINDFSGGLSQSSRLGAKNQFYMGNGVDLYENPGFMTPGWTQTNITLTSLTAGKHAREIIMDNVASVGYVFTDDTKAYVFSAPSTNTLSTNVDGASNTYVSITNMSADMKGIIYTAMYNGSLRRSLFLAYNTVGEIAVVNMGQANPYSAGNLDKTFLATRLSASALDNTGARDVIEFQGYLFFTNGEYVAKYDGSVGNYGTWTAQWFDLGVGWSADCFFITGNYLGVCASKNKSANGMSDCRIYILDGSSGTAAIKIIPVPYLNNINGAINKDGNIYIFGEAKNKNDSIGILGNTGFKEIYRPQIETNGFIRYIGSGNKNTINVIEDLVTFGLGINNKVTDGVPVIMAIDKNNKVSMPFSMGQSSNGSYYVYSAKLMQNTKLYVSFADGTNNFCSLDRGAGCAAVWKGLFYDFGERVRLNYIKFYYKIIGSGDTVTPVLSLDYGLKDGSGNIITTPMKDPRGNTTISGTNDAGTTTKRFNLNGVECHAIRPELTWTATSILQISKIVIDYSPTPDDY